MRTSERLAAVLCRASAQAQISVGGSDVLKCSTLNTSQKNRSIAFAVRLMSFVSNGRLSYLGIGVLFLRSI